MSTISTPMVLSSPTRTPPVVVPPITYGVWRPRVSRYGGYHTPSCFRAPEFCFRVTESSTCFCGVSLADHGLPDLGGSAWKYGLRDGRDPAYRKISPKRQRACGDFRYMPSNPSHISQDITTANTLTAFAAQEVEAGVWAAKCKRCWKPHQLHDASSQTCPGSFGEFASAWECLVCNRTWEDHETVFEGDGEVPCGRPGGLRGPNKNSLEQAWEEQLLQQGKDPYLVAPPRFRREDLGFPSFIETAKPGTMGPPWGFSVGGDPGVGVEEGERGKGQMGETGAKSPTYAKDHTYAARWP